MSTRVFCDNCNQPVGWGGRNSASFGVSPSTSTKNATKFKAYVAVGRHDVDGFKADLCGDCFKKVVSEMVRL